MHNYRKKERPKKYQLKMKNSLMDFRPHSFQDHKEVADHIPLQKLLCHINLYYLTFKTGVPPITYLCFVNNVKDDDILKALGYLCQFGWVSIVKGKGRYSYSITEKFQKAFYHPKRREEWRS